MTAGRPQDALELQRELIDWWSGPGGQQWGAAWLRWLGERLHVMSDRLDVLHDAATAEIERLDRFKIEAKVRGLDKDATAEDDPEVATFIERLYAELGRPDERKAERDELDAQYRALSAEHRDLGPNGPHPLDSGRGWLASRISHLRRASAFWVAEPMATLVDAAYASMPEQALRPEDVPVPAGFMLIDGAALLQLHTDAADERPAGFTAVSWEPAVGQMLDKEELRGIRVTWWFDPGSLPERHARLRSEFRARLIPHSIFWPYDWPEPPATVGEEEAHGCRWLLAAWHMMLRPLAVVERPPVERHARKRAVRAQLEPSVSVITLRHQSVKTVGPARKVDWQARWLVRGFWRQQWYPSIKEHRAVWIDAYVKGPEDRPLRITPKVYAWRR